VPIKVDREERPDVDKVYVRGIDVRVRVRVEFRVEVRVSTEVLNYTATGCLVALR